MVLPTSYHNARARLPEMGLNASMKSHWEAGTVRVSMDKKNKYRLYMDNFNWPIRSELARRNWPVTSQIPRSDARATSCKLKVLIHDCVNTWTLNFVHAILSWSLSFLRPQCSLKMRFGVHGQQAVHAIQNVHAFRRNVHGITQFWAQGVSWYKIWA